MRVEVLTYINNCKVVDEWIWYSVLFNQWELAPFMYRDGKFYFQQINKEALKEFAKKKEEEEKKLNRPKTEEEQRQDYKEMNELPKEEEELILVYQKDPVSEIIELSTYVDKLILLANKK